jgi:hypothetical protein
MLRSILLSLTLPLAALLAFAAPQKATAQYYQYYPPQAPYPQPPTPYPQPQMPYSPYPGPIDVRALGGTWYMNGRPAQVIPSAGGDRALFINENGGRAEGYIRGNTIFVPGWENLQGVFLGNTIRWSNDSVWIR